MDKNYMNQKHDCFRSGCDPTHEAKEKLVIKGGHIETNFQPAKPIKDQGTWGTKEKQCCKLHNNTEWNPDLCKVELCCPNCPLKIEPMKIDVQIEKMIADAITHGWDDANDGKTEPDKDCRKFAEATTSDILFLFTSLINEILPKEKSGYGKGSKDRANVDGFNEALEISRNRAKSLGIDLSEATK